jgi:hypothetical protein
MKIIVHRLFELNSFTIRTATFSLFHCFYSYSLLIYFFDSSINNFITEIKTIHYIKFISQLIFCCLLSTMNDIFSKTNFKLISNKRNIKKKYDSNRIDENISNYRNINEIERTLSLIKKKKKKIMSMISQWFQKNSENKIQYLKINDENIKITIFIKLISDKYQNYFENKSTNFINKTIKYLIQRCLKRSRRRKNIEVQNVFSMSFSSRQRAIESVISRSNFAENIRFQINLKEFNSINFCTMRDIVIDVTSNNANINIIQKVSLQKWRKVINKNMKLSFDFVIFYHLKDNILKINANK